MINANELRIGNWYNQYGYSHKADWVTIKDLTDAPKGLLWCKPIPLTEEILLKCGFKKESYAYTYKYFELSYDFYCAVNLNEYEIGEKIKYLHQLQNLYFALTGEELEIEL